eukprot:CAMPEP_0172493080 /NCGR_PEP_ID=MMETSP1066-20121228/24415_1 /TAXON_ID=671091 /ORGANISM="Coscinodiscus wailesii, Strain CCMP2513" /LENGTH=246 /DNA_ID=CAMNT_0013263053 /DNA_START=99 /DNA_END=839 /DNA_ORIENTATION=+
MQSFKLPVHIQQLLFQSILLITTPNLNVPSTAWAFTTCTPMRQSSPVKKIIRSMTATPMANDTETYLARLSADAEIEVTTRAPVISDQPQITTVTCANDLLDFLSEDDRVCVVKFHANWCKICKRVGVKFRRFAHQECDKVTEDGILVKKGRVRFADVEVSVNKELCEILEVKKFPFIQIYRNGDKIAAFSTGPPHNFKAKVEKTVLDKLAMSDEEHEAFGQQFSSQIADARAALDKLKEQGRLRP